MNEDGLSDDTLAGILQSARSFAVVGASNKPDRPSYGVMEFLIARGYNVHPVNPGLAGQEILGRKVYAKLADVPAPVDAVDVFRNSDAALDVVRDTIAQKDRLGLKVVWMQLGVINFDAARDAATAGLVVVMNRCPKIEMARLGLA
jgi:uncharacterized protein